MPGAAHDVARQHLAVAVDAEAQRRRARSRLRLGAGSDSAWPAASARPPDRATLGWRRGSRCCRGSERAPPASARPPSERGAAVVCGAGGCCSTLLDLGFLTFAFSGPAFPLLASAFGSGNGSVTSAGASTSRHRLDDLRLGLRRRLRRRLRLDHLRAGREVVLRGRRDRHRREIDEHRGRMRRAVRLVRGEQQIARHQRRHAPRTTIAAASAQRLNLVADRHDAAG